MQKEINANVFQSRCLGYYGWVKADIDVWRKKGEECAELELRVVFVQWTHWEKRRGTAVCERVNVLWKKPQGFRTLIGISIIIQPAFFFLCSSSSLSLSLLSVCRYVSVRCFRSMPALPVLTATVLSVLRDFNPIDSGGLSLHWGMGQHFNPEATLLCQNTLKGGIHSASVYTKRKFLPGLRKFWTFALLTIRHICYSNVFQSNSPDIRIMPIGVKGNGEGIHLQWIQMMRKVA